jgi:hypothetical protein
VCFLGLSKDGMIALLPETLIPRPDSIGKEKRVPVSIGKESDRRVDTNCSLVPNHGIMHNHHSFVICFHYQTQKYVSYRSHPLIFFSKKGP